MAGGTITLWKQEWSMAGRTSSKQGAIEIQISAHVRAPKNGRKISGQVIQDAIQYRIEHGSDPDGIELSIVRWRHPGKDWKFPAGDDTEWARFGRLLQHARVDVLQTRDR